MKTISMLGLSFASFLLPLHGADIDLAWDHSPDIDSLSGYNIYYGPASGFYTNRFIIPVVTNRTTITLIQAGPYYLTATSVGTNALESDYCNEILISIPYPPSNLHVVTNSI